VQGEGFHTGCLLMRVFRLYLECEVRHSVRCNCIADHI
jgi:hypothetical protein